MEKLKDFLNSKNKEKQNNKKHKRPYNERRVVTRSIMRNKLKYELKELGYKKVNKNFKYILMNMDLSERLKLLNK